MKFELYKDLIVVPVVFHYGMSRIKAQALVDTGSGGSALDINLVKFDFSRPTTSRVLIGIGGTQEVAVQDVEGIEFCHTNARNFPVEFGDITISCGFAAVIGGDLLDFLGVRIDYKQREIEVDPCRTDR